MGPSEHKSVDRKLLDRLRAGDREAAAEFLIRHRSKLRHRYRQKLGPRMRRLFDSLELVSTVARRLDHYLSRHDLRAANDQQMMALVLKIADNAIVDHLRVIKRIERADATAASMCRAFQTRFDQAESPGECDEIVCRAFECLASPDDRVLLSLWLQGMQLSEASEVLGVTPEAARQRWLRIRERVRDCLDSAPERTGQ